MMKTLNAALMLCMALAPSVALADAMPDTERKKIEAQMQKQTQPLSLQQKNIASIAAYAAVGDLTGLNAALNRGLDAGLTLSDCREILVQLYAYAGFPRSLNALGELMKVTESRRLAGQQDQPGQQPGPLPAPETMMAAGKRNQTALVGSPVKGPLFDFAPVMNDYLQSHLFGDIFERDNFSWKNRELATVGALAAMEGVEPQLKSHLGISINIGLTADQLSELVPFFSEQQQPGWADRLKAALNSVAQQ
ncbi:carboxymuconolactone decarboxylase family protein [Pantoea sp.]|uniref:carboxymuconolactone decarboxylase family protein n=1 Tax=Pantoea sp. TaxID=69393 RepID=UPI00290901F1|nr:carboxymuconolactone decarboxylase family protein [Pantoea sp.]MDU4127671.1 carboxymuconolactone decarboxylase family protein [Pantoea sp.]